MEKKITHEMETEFMGVIWCELLGVGWEQGNILHRGYRGRIFP